MLFTCDFIRANERADISPFRQCGRVIVGCGRHCALHGVAPGITVLAPLKGSLGILTGQSSISLRRGQVITIESTQQVHAIGDGLFVAVLLPFAMWRSLLDARRPAADPALFPYVHDADRSTLRSIVQLARAAARQDQRMSRLAAVSFAHAMAVLQAPFDQLIARCPGRAWAQRRSVFLRLLRARNLMQSDCHRNLDVGHFASLANYSMFHFIRAFRSVYGKTPHAELVEQRLRRAHDLLNTSPLAVYEIALIAGFEDRSAFARSFKRRYGISATDLRQQFQRRSLQAVA
jgi:AraC family transcriptional regulator